LRPGDVQGAQPFNIAYKRKIPRARLRTAMPSCCFRHEDRGNQRQVPLLRPDELSVLRLVLAKCRAVIGRTFRQRGRERVRRWRASTHRRTATRRMMHRPGARSGRASRSPIAPCLRSRSTSRSSERSNATSTPPPSSFRDVMESPKMNSASSRHAPCRMVGRRAGARCPAARSIGAGPPGRHARSAVPPDRESSIPKYECLLPAAAARCSCVPRFLPRVRGHRRVRRSNEARRCAQRRSRNARTAPTNRRACSQRSRPPRSGRSVDTWAGSVRSIDTPAARAHGASRR
jgi:hypothetical protein